MAFYSSTRRTEEVHASSIRVFKQSSVVPQQQQHDHDSKPESWFVLHVPTCTRFVDQVRGYIGSTTTFDKKPFPFDLNTLSSSLSLELFANSIAQETGLVSRENCGLLAKEISDGLFSKFKFSKDAIYGTTSLAILVQVSRAVLEELDQTDFVATPTDHGFLSDQLEQGNLDHVVVVPDNIGSTETANSDHEDQQENDRAVVIVPAIILGNEISFENHEVPAPTGWDIETSMDEEHEESYVFFAHTAGRGITSSTDEDQQNDHADRNELTSSADDKEQQDHGVATSTALNKTSAGDQEQVNHVAAPTSPGEEQENHVHDAFANEEVERDYDFYDDSVGVEERDYDVYSSGTEEEERDYDVYNDSGEEDDDEIESLDSSLDVFDDGFFDNDDDDLIGDGPEGYEEAVAFEVIVDDDRRNVIESNDPCSICLEGYSSCGIEVAKTHCGHMFHKHCIIKWLATHMTCPFCRSACIALV